MPLSENWIWALPSAPVVAVGPIVFHEDPLLYWSLNTRPCWTGSTTPSAVAVGPQSLPVQSRLMLNVTTRVGLMVSTSVRSLFALRAKTR